MRARTRMTWIVIAGVGAGAAPLIDGCISSNNANPSADAGSFDGAAPTEDSASPPGTDSSSPDSGADTGTDAGAVTDSAPAVDAPVDTGVDAGCAPSLPALWTPPPYVHAAGTFQADCSGTPQIDQFWQACIGGDAASPATCAAYPEAGLGNAQCGACLHEPADAGVYGAAYLQVLPLTNVAGCIELADPSDAGLSCATAIQSLGDCLAAACQPSCPITSDPATTAAYVACAQAAATSVCASYATPATTCSQNEITGGPVEITEYCYPPDASVETQFDEIGFFFCGS